MSNIKELLGKRIRELRKEYNITQETLAEKSNIEIATLSNIERGKNYPNYETIEKLSIAFNIMPYELFVFDHLKTENHLVLIDEMTTTMKKDKELTQKLYNIFLAYKRKNL